MQTHNGFPDHLRSHKASRATDGSVQGTKVQIQILIYHPILIRLILQDVIEHNICEENPKDVPEHALGVAAPSCFQAKMFGSLESPKFAVTKTGHMMRAKSKKDQNKDFMVPIKE